MNSENKKLSIVIPAYNEGKTIAKLLELVYDLKLPYSYEKEIIVVNDFSSDSTGLVVRGKISKWRNAKLIDNDMNLGKTQSVKKGLTETTGDFVVIQDADLEYDPKDLIKMLRLAIEDNLDVVYGSRFSGQNKMLYRSFYLGNKLVTFVSNLFTFLRIRRVIPDMEVCYKLVRGDIIRKIAPRIVSKSGFGLEPEITARLARTKGLRWGIVPISYNPRTIEEGKKINYIDGIKAIVEIIRFNLF